MISHGRKSDEKCYVIVEKLARFAVVVKEFCVAIVDGI